MEQEGPTCGQGLAEHAALLEKMGELTAAVAEILELHMQALDLADAASRTEHAAYLELAEEHRSTAIRLMATARRMAGCRELPMGKHDESAMADPRAGEVFARFVKLEQELLVLLRIRLAQDREMLAEMDQPPTQDG